MSNSATNKRSTTPKKQRSRSQLQQKENIQEDICVRTSLPPFVEGPVYAILICHIPKLRWLAKNQSLYRSIAIKVAWWGENNASATFNPQISGSSPDHRQQPSITAKYNIRSELKQFSKYLTDAAELVLKVFDTETNRVIGTVKVQNLSTLSTNNPIKGYLPIFSNKGDKLGELFVSLRLFLPGTNNSNENLTKVSYTSDISNPPSRRNSIGANDYNQNDQLENGLRTYTIGRAYDTEYLNSISSNEANTKHRSGSTTSFQSNATNLKNAPPGMQAYKELPTGKVVQELIERANRLRENMIKSTIENTTTIRKNNHPIESTLLNNNNNNNNAKIHGTKSFEMLVNDIDPSIDNENICDMLSLKLTTNLNDSNNSILTDLDGLENEQSLLDDLLYGGDTGGDHSNNNRKYNTSSTNKNNKNYSYGKPPTGRSRSPSMTRINGSSSRSHSAARSRSLTRSSDSDTASRVSFDMHTSDIDDSKYESHDEDELSIERIQLLNYVRTARIRIDHLRLNILNDRESPSHSSFGRTNKSKRALNYYIEYQFPTIVNNHDYHINEATEVMKISSKRFESNNDIIFSHLSTYPYLFNETSFKHWWRSLLIFKIYSRMSGTTNSEQIGFAVLPLRNIFKSDYLHIEQDLNVIDCIQMSSNNQKIPNKVAKKFCIGQLHVMLEFDSDKSDFKTELDRIQLIEQMKPKIQRVTKSKRIKKSKKLIINSNNNLQIPKNFITNNSLLEGNDGLVVQMYLSVVEARNITSKSNNDNLPRNPYFVCRAFWNEEPITSVVCWGSSTPRFNFEQKIPLLLTKSTIEKMHQNFVIIELWDKKISGPSDQIIGIIKIPLEQFYISFKDKQISRVLLRAQYPVISIDSWLPIIDPFTSTNKSAGEIQVLLAMGTSDQITAVQIAHAGGDLFPSSKTNNISTITNNNNNQSSSSSLIEHHFEIMIESINGLRAFESMVWGESDCFIQYSFPTQHEQQLINVNSIKSFQLRTIRTATTLCTSDPTFHDTNKFRYVLSPADALHKYFYAACQSTTPIEASIPFEVWSRFYYPNIRDQLLAKGKLPVAKLCSMTTMLNSDTDDKSIQSFRIPLEIVKEDSKHEQHHYTSTPIYGGDLLITVNYKRKIVKQNESKTVSSHSSNDNAQVCISVGIIRACGLKHAAVLQARHDDRFNYLSQVGLNTYAKLTFSFLSDIESRSTRTIARSFVPEYNHSIDFPISLIWNDHRNKSISLAEMLEHGELKIDIYHKINSDSHEKQSSDIHLCYCIIPLKELISRHTGIKGWYPLNNVGIKEISSDSIENCVGGIELFIRFSQQDDHRRMIDSAKTLGWIDENYIDEENFLDDQKDLGCLVKLSIDRIQFPIQLVTQSDKERTSVFAQYRFYDKMPIITKRKKATFNKNNCICDLQFNKKHLFLCSTPFLWYLREEKLEIQIWTSENDIYDYSQNLASTTDKFIGSIYVDLNLLCNKKRKSHRLNTTLPIFKQGTKDLTNAYVQIHITMDKSKDFNDLKSQNDLDASNDIELDSYLENNHLNLINNDRFLRTITNNIFTVLINIEQAAHLPNIYSKEKNLHIPPNPYVTYSTADTNYLCRTQVLTSTQKPQWNYQQSIKLSIEHLFNEKKVFILKVWHKINADIESIPEKSGDQVLGFVSIDLSPLLSGLQQISGWYNIIDTIGNVQGQLKISIIPQEDLFQFKRMKYNSKIDSYRSTSTNSDNPSTLILNDLSARSSTGERKSLNSSIIDDESNKQSFLMNNLRRQLSELDVITERLKARYYSNSEISSTITTSRSSTDIPSSSSTIVPLFNLSSIHQDNDNIHSTTTTIKKDLLEQFPESLSGKPLISNGLNVTDVLSLHNDQVRLAQELMTKANHLLETSKDFFNKPSTPPLLPSSTIMQNQSNQPETLPNFNATKEFETIDNNLSQHINNSFDQQQENNSIIWSDEEADENNQSFLPIGLPPTHYRSILPTTISPPSNFKENSTHQDDINVVHIRPLNNLSAFNFDCQQMNAERLNNTTTNNINSELSHHTRYSPDISINKKTLSQSINSSNSQTPLQQSFTSDISIVDNINKQSKQIDLSLEKKSLPNFFPTNHEMEVSIKQVSQALTTSARNNVIKTINEQLHGQSPIETINTKRIEQIFQTKYPSN